ncbi:hypothetical protein ACWCQP_46885 [Streptomyces chartreusis]
MSLSAWIFLPGVFWFAALMAMMQVLMAGFRYVMSSGDQGTITAAKNQMLYGVAGLVALPVPLVIAHLVFAPSLSEVGVGAGVGAVLFMVGLALLTSSTVPRAMAAYSAWWMPQVERTSHRQDILYALTCARWGMQRSRHAWSLLKSSPRAGLRSRRHHARLKAAVMGDRREARLRLFRRPDQAT